MATRVRLIHWNADEALKRAKTLRTAGYVVDSKPFDGPGSLRALRNQPPDAIVIDLSRAPAQGRDVALALREAKATRHVPLVLVEGDPEKVKRVKQLLPDATYTDWSHVRGALKRALASPPTDPVVPSSRLAGYSGTSLPKKLGIKPDMVVGLVAAPEDFEKTLGALPDGVTLRRGARGRCDLIIWFVTKRSDLKQRVKRLGESAGPGGLWIAWPKKTSGVTTDVTQNDVRQLGLDAGLVDYKVCAIDETWSGLRFAKHAQRKR